MASKDLTVVDQLPLAIARKPIAQPLDASVIFAQRDALAALNLAINVSGLEDKEVYLALGIDAGHWSRIRKGEAHYPLNKLNDLCDLLGNEVLLVWWAHSRGKGLVMLETEAERQLRMEHDARIKAEDQVRMLKELLVGRQA